jgi:hypothetical protein
MRMLVGHSEEIWETTPSFSMDSEKEGGIWELSQKSQISFYFCTCIKDELPFGLESTGKLYSFIMVSPQVL